MKRRTLSLALAGCMLARMLSIGAMAGELAQPVSCEPGCSLESGHEGDCVLYDAGWQNTEDGEWVYGSLAAACANVYSGGTVEVLRDIVLESSVRIQKALTITSADPEAPCKITHAAKDRDDCLLMISAKDVILADIILDGGREEGLTAFSELVSVGYLETSTLTMKAGTVLQNNDNVSTDKAAGGLRVHTRSTVVMEEGSVIRNCRGVAGGGVAVADGESTLTLNGGVIENCQAFVGGGIYLSQNGGMLNLNSGAIRGNQAMETMEGMSYTSNSPPAGSGGGISVFKGMIRMMGSGCTIAENYAKHCGGGIYINNGILQMGNGSIVKNRSDGYGGGIVVSPSITGSTSLTIFFGYGPRVTGNISGKEYFHDVYMDGMEDEYSYVCTTPITIGAPLLDIASIGVARWLRPDQDHPYRIVAVPNATYTITKSDLEKFFSNDPHYVVLLHEGNIVLANADVIFDNQGHGVAPQSQRVGEVRKVIEPEALTEEGYSFGGWYQEPECVNPWDFENGTIAEVQEEPLILYAKWQLVPYSIRYELDGGENAAENPESYTIESETITLKAPTKEGCDFLGWTWEGEGDAQAGATIPTGSTGERGYTAHWTASSYTVTFDVQGHGTAPEAQSVSHGGKADRPGEPAASGWKFGGWYQEAGCENLWDFERDTVTGSVTLYAKWTKQSVSPSRPSRPDPEPEEETPPYTPPGLESEEHFAYIVGYPDGTVRPEAYITRAEVAAVFFRLMTDDFRAEHWATENPFSDVDPGNWYNNAVSTAVRAGLLRGLPDGTFGGDRDITRGEFAAIAARFLSEETAPDSGFPDMAGHWAQEEVDRAVAAGWIKGYPDGSFHPDDCITRAEVMALVNRMLGRAPRAEGMREDMIRWPDNPAAAWYYADVQEATNGHTYERDGESGAESWTALTENRDWTELEE